MQVSSSNSRFSETHYKTIALAMFISLQPTDASAVSTWSKKDVPACLSLAVVAAGVTGMGYFFAKLAKRDFLNDQSLSSDQWRRKRAPYHRMFGVSALAALVGSVSFYLTASSRCGSSTRHSDSSKWDCRF